MTAGEGQVRRHPQWKHLLDSCLPLLQPDAFFSYELLSELAGIDIQSPAGRNQFAIFRRHVLHEQSYWLENERNRGYHVVRANEHPRCAGNELRKARRRIRRGREITVCTRLDTLTDEERRINADMLVRLARIDAFAAGIHQEVRNLIAERQPYKRLPSPLKPD